jgi:transcriptional regulator
MQIVSDLQRDHEAERENPWALAFANQDFLQELIKHVVGFTVNITSVEAKYKLEQKEKQDDRAKIVSDLQSSERTGDQYVAGEMKRLFNL